jgi:ferredoxin
MKFKVSHEKCIGAGACAEVAGRVFSQNDDDGLIIVLDEDPPPSEYENVRQAARLCPALAIKILEEDSKSE